MKILKSAQQVFSALLFFTTVLLSWSSGVVATESVLNGPDQAVESVIELATVDKVNINQANFEQLVALPGIGKVKASAILEYRQQVGLFGSIEELQNIRGIGAKLYAKLVSKIEI